MLTGIVPLNSTGSVPKIIGSISLILTSTTLWVESLAYALGIISKSESKFIDNTTAITVRTVFDSEGFLKIYYLKYK